jgi:excisionase family DNA binding protein
MLLLSFIRVCCLEMLNVSKELIIDLREGNVSECRPDLDAKRETVYMWITDRRMPAHEVGMPWKFMVSEIDAWVQRGMRGESTPYVGGDLIGWRAGAA